MKQVYVVSSVGGGVREKGFLWLRMQGAGLELRSQAGEQMGRWE